MKIPTAAVLCFLFPKISEGIFPFRDVLSKVTSTSAPLVFDTTGSRTRTAAGDDVPTTFEQAKALLMTVPVYEKSKTTDQDKAIASPEGDALVESIDRAPRLTTINKFSSIVDGTSPIQWAILLSSMVPVSLLEKTIGTVLGNYVSLGQQHDIVRVFRQEYRVLACVVAASMSLPQQYTKAAWFVYAAVRALPHRRSLVSLLMSAAVLLQQADRTGRLAGFRNMALLSPQSHAPVLLAGLSLLPLLHYAVRGVGTLTNSKKVAFVLSDCLLKPEEFAFPAVAPTIRSDVTTEELRPALASVPLNRLIAARPVDHLWNNNKDSRYCGQYAKPAVELWRIGTSVQFWQSIYHAVKHDEYYCLVEDEQEPVAIA